ncbi:helix-turn-helix domain-containing protein [Lactococcus garvieae]|uniref:helix-turn-helix domain-containing protein n=1 Tax=Lactococcus garvieae TaxID=1363 RepID=UPI0038542D74
MVVIVVPLLYIITTTIDQLIRLNKLKQQEKIFFSLGTMDRGGGYSFKEVSDTIDNESKASRHVVELRSSQRRMSNFIFSSQILKLRNNHGLSMSEFATELGVTKSRVNMWENKGVVPREDILRKISKKYDISMHVLLTGSRSKELQDPLLQSIMQRLNSLDNKHLRQAEKLLSLVFEWEGE